MLLFTTLVSEFVFHSTHDSSVERACLYQLIALKKFPIKFCKHSLFSRCYADAWGHAVAQLVEAGLNPYGATAIFHSHIPSGRTMALGLTQPLTEMRTRNISWVGKGGRCVGLTTWPPSFANCLEIWEPQPPGTLRVCPGTALPSDTMLTLIRAVNRRLSTQYSILFLSFRRVLNVIYSFLGNSPASEF